jgi:hypothetical protein
MSNFRFQPINIFEVKVKVKGKVHPIPGHEGPEGE